MKKKVYDWRGEIVVMETVDKENLLPDNAVHPVRINVQECLDNGYMTLEDFDKK